MISTRGRYALKVMLDLAQNQGTGYVPMKDVAARQGLSLKYLEQILPTLTRNKLVEGLQGKGGGYRLSKEPDKIAVGDILRLTEKELSPVSCLAQGATECERKTECKTLKFWAGFNNVVNNYIDNVSLADLL